MTIDWRKHLDKTTYEVKKIVNLEKEPIIWNKFLNEYMKLHNHLKKKAV